MEDDHMTCNRELKQMGVNGSESKGKKGHKVPGTNNN